MDIMLSYYQFTHTLVRRIKNRKDITMLRGDGNRGRCVYPSSVDISWITRRLINILTFQTEDGKREVSKSAE